MKKIHLIYLLLFAFSLDIHAQCSSKVIDFFDEYFLTSKQISNTNDSKLIVQLLNKRAASNFFRDSIYLHPECHREYPESHGSNQ